VKPPNAAGQNYWPIYIAEIISRLGLSADTLDPSALGDAAQLSQYALVFVGAGAALPPARRRRRAPERLGLCRRGARRPGCEGLDEVFGVSAEGIVEQPDAPYGISAYLRLEPGPLTAEIHAEGNAQPLIIIAPARKLVPQQASAVAALLMPSTDRPGYGRAATPTEWSAVTDRALGAGRAVYFGFDLAQTMWLLHQGRPVDADRDGDGYWRTPDARLDRGERRRDAVQR